MKLTVLGLCAALAVSCAALNGSSGGAHAKAAHEPADLARLRTLEGSWTGSASLANGESNPVAVEFHLTGGGSALVETLFPGTPHEMVTVYHADGADLVLTHYCAAGNQPRMRLTTPGAQELVFEFDGGSNLDAAVDGHMHMARLELVDANHLRARWSYWANGKPDHDAHFDLTRASALAEQLKGLGYLGETK